MLSLVDEIDAAAVVAEKGWNADGVDLIGLLQGGTTQRVCFSISRKGQGQKTFRAGTTKVIILCPRIWGRTKFATLPLRPERPESPRV